MKKIIPLVALCGVLAQYAVAATNNEVTIITDNFAISSSSNTNGVATQAVSSPSIGKVGTLNIVEGKRPAGVIAYVQQSANADYLIGDTLLIKCKQNTNCVPSSYNPTKLGDSNLYQIKVSNYEQWQQAIADLKNNENVVSVDPHYEYGRKPTIK